MGKTKGNDLGSAEAYVRSIFDDAASDDDSEEDSNSGSESDDSDGDASEEEDADADAVEEVLAEETAKSTKGNSKSAMHKGLKTPSSALQLSLLFSCCRRSFSIK